MAKHKLTKAEREIIAKLEALLLISKVVKAVR